MGIQNSEREFTRAAIAIEELTTTVHDRLDEIEKRVNRPSFGDTSKAHDQYKAALSTLVATILGSALSRSEAIQMADGV